MKLKNRVELEEIGAEFEAHNADVEGSQEEQKEVEVKLTELRETLSKIENVRYDLITEQENFDPLHAEQRNINEEL